MKLNYWLKRIALLYFRSLGLQIFLVWITVASIIVAILETYIPFDENHDEANGLGGVSITLESVFFTVFAIDLIMDFIRAPYKIDYLLSLAFFYDITACISILIVVFPQSGWLIFARFFRVFKITEVMRLRHYISVSGGSRVHASDVAAFETTAVTYFMARLVVNIFAFLIISTAAIYVLSKKDSTAFSKSSLFWDIDINIYYCIQ